MLYWKGVAQLVHEHLGAHADKGVAKSLTRKLNELSLAPPPGDTSTSAKLAERTMKRTIDFIGIEDAGKWLDQGNHIKDTLKKLLFILGRRDQLIETQRTQLAEAAKELLALKSRDKATHQDVGKLQSAEERAEKYRQHNQPHPDCRAHHIPRPRG